MAVLNPSFEDQGTEPGQAEHWTLSAHTTLEKIAGFGPEPFQAWEDFERWFELLVNLAPGQLTIAFFDPMAEGYEDFEEKWASEIYLFDLPEGHIVIAPFGGNTVEDMEDGWLLNEYHLDWSELMSITGLFDTEPSEDFEEQWRSNHLFDWHWSDVTSLRGYFDGGSDPDEDFTNDWSLASTI